MTWCASHDVPLHVLDWRSEYEAAGLARDAIYLLRPDTYVALADASGTPATLDRYCADHGIPTLTASKSTFPTSSQTEILRFA
jgi:hypothetical protein